MIPKPKRLLYDFDNMEPEMYIVARNYKHSMAIYGTGRKRGFNVCVRTVGKEIRVYLKGKLK